MERGRVHILSNNNDHTKTQHAALAALVQLLLDCIGHQEQLPVRANDVLSPSGELLRGVDALCALRRHTVKVRLMHPSFRIVFILL